MPPFRKCLCLRWLYAVVALLLSTALARAVQPEVVYEFGFGPANPSGPLVQGFDGNFYGATSKGGKGFGTLFRVTTNGDWTTLVSFTGTNGSYPGSDPEAGLILAPDGSFYGTTRTGGTHNSGTIFQVTTNGELTSLVSLVTNGIFPEAGLTLGPDGAF